MKSLKRRFNNVAQRNPYWSSYICFAEAVKGQRFNKRTVHYWFNKLVSKSDYFKSEKRAILSHLDNLSSAVEDSKKQE